MECLQCNIQSVVTAFVRAAVRSTEPFHDHVSETKQQTMRRRNRSLRTKTKSKTGMIRISMLRYLHKHKVNLSDPKLTFRPRKSSGKIQLPPA